MSFSDDLVTRLVYEIASSYESRLSSVGRTLGSAYESLEDLRSRRQEAAEVLRRGLRVPDSLMNRALGRSIEELIDAQNIKEKRLRELLRLYVDEQRDRANELRGAVSGWTQPARSALVREMLDRVKKRQDEMEAEIFAALEDLRQGQMELDGAMAGIVAGRRETEPLPARVAPERAPGAPPDGPQRQEGAGMKPWG
ncbi:MAG: hypothetical protein Kow0025_00870 [Thermodesulfovibrionales bacterium]